jgi:hypothetical protein
MTGFRMDDRVLVHGGGRHYSFSATFRQIFKPTQPYIQCLPGATEYSFPLNLQDSGKMYCILGYIFSKCSV